MYKDHIAITKVEADIDDGFIIAAQAADELLNIKGIVASFVMAQAGNIIAISGRSHGEINVQIIINVKLLNFLSYGKSEI